MAAERLDGWTVKVIPLSRAERWIPKYHYSGTVGRKTATFYGVSNDKGRPMCVVAIGNPSGQYGQSSALGLTAFDGNYEITRVAAHPQAPKNTASKAITLACKMFAETTGKCWVYSYADTGQSHHGGIYQALNAIYCGPTKASGFDFLIVDGVRTHRRVAYDRFGTSSPKKLEALGHAVVGVPGTAKHTYVLPIGTPAVNRAIRKILKPRTLPYPKRKD